MHAARGSFLRWMDRGMYCFWCSTGLYHSETIGINTTNIELILNLIILLVFMGGMVSQWLAMYIIYFHFCFFSLFFLPLNNSNYILHTDVTLIYVYLWLVILIFNLSLYNTVYSWTRSTCNIHGLDRHRRYIYIYTVVLQKAEESSRTEQNNTSV